MESPPFSSRPNSGNHATGHLTKSRADGSVQNSANPSGWRQIALFTLARNLSLQFKKRKTCEFIQLSSAQPPENEAEMKIKNLTDEQLEIIAEEVHAFSGAYWVAEHFPEFSVNQDAEWFEENYPDMFDGRIIRNPPNEERVPPYILTLLKEVGALL